MKIRSYDKISVLWLTGMAMIVIPAISGCSQPAGTVFAPPAEPLVWPQPPEQARVGYVGMISTEQDLKPAVPWSQGLSELFFGKDEIGVLVSPMAVAFGNDKIFVTDSTAVHVFNLESRRYQQVNAMGKNQSLMMPVAIALVDENMYVTDSVLQKVCVFGQNGTFKFAFGQDVLERPTGIAYAAASKRLYVTDTANHTIKVFDKAGSFSFKFGSRGIEPGQFNFPTHLWVDTDNRLYVSDTLNYRVQVFSSDGVFLRMFGVHGDRPGNFAHPAGIATDSQGHIYVVDKQYENIQIFDDQGDILMAFGIEGNGPGDFWLPAGIFICKNDWIYVADTFNKRIQVFEFLKSQGDDGS
jgi:DNA-binding beta-propeller fold protein YncE